MIRTAIFIRDLVIAVALAWIGVHIEPAREQACQTVKGADAAPMCTPARGASFDVAGFGVEMAGEQHCATTIR